MPHSASCSSSMVPMVTCSAPSLSVKSPCSRAVLASGTGTLLHALEALDVLLLGGNELSLQVPQRPSLLAFRLGVAGKLMGGSSLAGSAHHRRC
jgi:hypothetical protein